MPGPFRPVLSILFLHKCMGKHAEELHFPMKKIICICSSLQSGLRCLKRYYLKVRLGQPGGKSFR